MCARGVLFTKDPYEHFSRALNIFFLSVQKAFCVRGLVCAAYIVRVIVYCCAYKYDEQISRSIVDRNKRTKRNRGLSAQRSSACAHVHSVYEIFKTRDTLPDVLA